MVHNGKPHDLLIEGIYFEVCITCLYWQIKDLAKDEKINLAVQQTALSNYVYMESIMPKGS